MTAIFDALFVYFYCTDFVINLANLLDLSYYEINAIIFCFLYPVALVGLAIWFLVQKWRLARLLRAQRVSES